MKPYYQDAAVTLYHGDCREVLLTLQQSIDLLLTDPPYELTAKGGGIGAQRKYLSDIDGELDSGFDFSLLNPYRNWMAFCAKAQLLRLLSHAEQSEGRWMLLTWNKPNPTPLCGGNYLPDVEYIVHRFGDASDLHGGIETRSRFILSPSRPSSIMGHPTAKPLIVMKRLVAIGSADASTILDPFCGSGTTLRAAKDLGRKAIGIEIEERYCEIAAKRCAQEVLPLGVHHAI